MWFCVLWFLVFKWIHVAPRLPKIQLRKKHICFRLNLDIRKRNTEGAMLGKMGAIPLQIS